MRYLPTEILAIIAQWLSLVTFATPALQKSTLNVLLVSKMWYYCMRPFIWHDVCLTSSDQVDHFIRTVWKRPNLRPLVHNLRFKFPANAPKVRKLEVDPDVEVDQVQIRAQELQMRASKLELRKAICNRLFTDLSVRSCAKFSWLAGLRSDVPWHWFLILTLILTKLEILDIAPGYLNKGMEHIYQVFMWVSEIEPPRLANLKYFRVQRQLRGRSTHHPDFLIPLLQLPSLNRLYVSDLGFTRAMAAQKIFGNLGQIRGASKIRHLKLRFNSSDWNTQLFSDFLARLERLESFSIEVVNIAPPAGTRTTSLPVNGWARAVWHALLPHASTLRHLQLVQAGAVDLLTSFGLNAHWFGSLAVFGQLQGLDISLSSLFRSTPNPVVPFGEELLESLTPANLRRLVIRGVRPCDLELLGTTMRELLVVRETKLPRWESLEIPRTRAVWGNRVCIRWMNFGNVVFCGQCDCCRMAKDLWLECGNRGILFSTYDDCVFGGKPTW